MTHYRTQREQLDVEISQRGQRQETLSYRWHIVGYLLGRFLRLFLELIMGNQISPLIGLTGFGTVASLSTSHLIILFTKHRHPVLQGLVGLVTGLLPPFI